MAWWQFSLLCQSCELEQVEDLLLQQGAQSISLSDAGDEPIYEPLPGDTPVWQQSIVSAIFAADIDWESRLQQLQQSLPQQLASSVRLQLLQDQDWEQVYRQHFKPLRCAENLWIVPSWCEPPDPAATVVRLDPGMAFGTGGHATTAMCLQWLAMHDIEQLRVIDYGCGSGILSIAACKLGAASVVAVDIDPQALQASETNLRENDIDPTCLQLSAPGQMDRSLADLLMANILAGPLVSLAADFAELVRPGGRILLSGILKTQLKEIQSAYRPYFELDPADEREQWVCVSGKRI